MTMAMSKGVRSINERQHQVTVEQWAKHFGISVPTVKVRQSRKGRYRVALRRITIPAHKGPGEARETLIHEFAHHLDCMVGNRVGHGPTFRISLVQVAVLACGQAQKYNWKKEYKNIQSWAQKHKLMS